MTEALSARRPSAGAGFAAGEDPTCRVRSDPRPPGGGSVFLLLDPQQDRNFPPVSPRLSFGRLGWFSARTVTDQSVSSWVFLPVSLSRRRSEKNQSTPEEPIMTSLSWSSTTV